MKVRVAVPWIVLGTALASLSVVPIKAAASVKVTSRPISPTALAPKKNLNLDLNVTRVLYCLGLQADHLTAAGVSEDMTSAVVGAVRDWVGQNPNRFVEIDARLLTASDKCASLFRLVQGGRGTAEDIAGLPAARAVVDSIVAERDKVAADAFDAVTVSLNAVQTATLTTIRTNEAAWHLPLEFLVVERTKEEWIRLRTALDNERIAMKDPEDLDLDDQAYLSIVRSIDAVATAKVNLDTRLASVQTAWEAAAALQGE